MARCCFSSSSTALRRKLRLRTEIVSFRAAARNLVVSRANAAKRDPLCLGMTPVACAALGGWSAPQLLSGAQLRAEIIVIVDFREDPVGSANYHTSTPCIHPRQTALGTSFATDSEAGSAGWRTFSSTTRILSEARSRRTRW